MTSAATTTTTDIDAAEELASSSPEREYGACRDDAPSENAEQDDDNTASDNEAVAEAPNGYLVWRKPWMIALGFFFFYYFFWFFLVIIGRYWMREAWEEVLPGLGTTALRKFTIRNHMTFGGIAILCSPIQMITPFTAAWKKNGVHWYRKLHRNSGRVYVVCAILSFIFGQWFIFLKQFLLVGGYNMGLAFSAAGFAIAYFAYMTWETAPSRNREEGVYTVEDHRNYAIRSVGQIIAPILYRYWYTFLMIFKVYDTPHLNNGDDRGVNLVCNDRNVCQDYERPFDALYCWLYWISAWVVSEILILYLPKHQKTNGSSSSSSSSSTLADQMEAPLLETPEPGNNVGNTASEQVQGGGEANQKPSPRIVNFVGCLLAVLTVMVSGPIMIGLFTKIANSF